MSQRIWRKNPIKFQHCFILNLVKYVETHMVKKCNIFPTLFYLKVGEICRNGYVQKMQ